MMETLYNKCPSKHKELAKIPNGEHNDTWKQQDYMHHLKSFIDRVLDEEARADS